MTPDERAMQVVDGRQWEKISYVGGEDGSWAEYGVDDAKLTELIAAAIRDAEQIAWAKGWADARVTCETAAATLAKNWREDDTRHQGQFAIADAIGALPDGPSQAPGSQKDYLDGLAEAAVIEVKTLGRDAYRVIRGALAAAAQGAAKVERGRLVQKARDVEAGAGILNDAEGHPICRHCCTECLRISSELDRD